MNRRAIALSTLSLVLLAGHAQADLCRTVTKLGNFNTPGAADHFGSALSMSFGGLSNAPLLAVGRPNDDAPVAGNDAGGFTVYQKINGWSIMYDSFNTTGQGGEQLGFSIALADPYLIAGAPGYNSDSGRARIYRRPSNGSGFSSQTDVVTTIGAAGSRFGEAVAISTYGGGWAVVGAPLHDFHGEIDAGAAFFFALNPSTNEWEGNFQIWGGDFGGKTGDHRGSAVAMSQATPYAVIGSPNFETNASVLNHGQVRIVTRLASGLPSGQTVAITPPNPEADEHFGAAVAIEGNLLVVGAPDEDLTFQESGFVQAATDGGAIYIYERNASNGTWEFKAKLRSPTPTSGGHFGAKVATDGGLQIMVSEPGTKRAYAFSSLGGTWHYQAAFYDTDTAANGSFGNDVAVRNGEIAIADQLDDHTSQPDAGAVYVTTLGYTVATGDTCADPLDIPAGDFIGCTENATASQFAATNCGSAASQGPDVYFIFQPTCSGNAIFDTFGSEFDTVLSVHSGCPNNFASNTLVCNDDASFAAPNNRASLVTFNFDAGETYYVRVAGFSGSKGQFTLRHLFTYGVSNDTCATATTVGMGTVNFNTCAASSEALSTSCAGAVFNDLWYRFIAPQAGDYRFTVCSANVAYDTVLTVYNGTQQNCPNSTASEIACNDDSADACSPLNSRVNVTATAGQSMLIRIAGYAPDDSGAGTLTIEMPQPFNCPADFNHDGTLDPDDLADYIGAYFTVPAPLTADFNADGTVDPDDLADYIGAFFNGCGN